MSDFLLLTNWLASRIHVSTNAPDDIGGELVSIQGVCQLYYYFTIVALCGSLAYTFISIIDRLVKFQVIFDDLVNYVDFDYIFYLKNLLKTVRGIDNDGRLWFKSSQHEQIRFETATGDLLVNHVVIHAKRTSQHPLVSNLHSVTVRQLCNKYTSLLVGILILVINLHILWIYGAIPYDFTADTLVPFEIIGNYSMDGEHASMGNNNVTNSDANVVGAGRVTSVCVILYSIDNYLPLYLFNMDLAVLLVCLIGILLACWRLLFKYRKYKCFIDCAHVVQHTYNQATVSHGLYESKHEFLFRCVIWVGAATFLFAFPSLLARFLLIIIITMRNSHVNLRPYEAKLRTVCDVSDLFLLTISSHKFFLFLINCELVRFKRFRKKI
jgi:hypothetical protein